VATALLIAAVASSAGAGVPARAHRVTAAGSARAKAPGARTHAAGTAKDRTLEDIHIEGEIPVPQVLFITARDQRRFLEFQHHRYLRSSRQLGDDTPVPSKVIVTGTGATHDKETPR